MNVADVNESLFWAKVDKSGGGEACWPWLACYDRYGRFRVKGKARLAHRISYTLLVGEITDGLVLDHLCRNTKCVNPTHLEPVTQRENMRRGVFLGIANLRKTACPQGHMYNTTNTYVTPTGDRKCRECNRLRAIALRDRLRKAVAANG